MVKKAHKTLSHADAVRFGRMGGSPILASYVEHRPVKGYKVTHVGSKKHSKKR